MEFFAEFKKTDWSNRLAKAQAMQKKYPHFVPVVVDRVDDKSPKMTQNRFMVPKHYVVAQLLGVIKKKIQGLKESQGIVLFLHGKNEVPKGTALMSELYATHHDKQDNLLYFTYSVEHTFGNQQ